MKKKLFLDKFRQKIKDSSLKQSKQREEIIKIFLEQKNHIDAESLYGIIKKRHPQIGYTTVYRTLKLLCDLDMAISHSFNKNMAFFEPILDTDMHHDHLICTKCGKIEEFHNKEIESLQDKIAESYGFKITSHVLNMYGLCKECRGELND